MSITKEYLKLSKEYQSKFGEKTIIYMMVGKFYEVYAIMEDDISNSNANVDIQNIAITCVRTLGRMKWRKI